MKFYEFLLGCLVLFIVACGDDSTSAFDAWSENISSSSSQNVILSSSEGSRGGVKASSSSTEPALSSAEGIEDLSSSSSAKKLSGEVSGDPLQIFKTRVPKKAVYHCDLTQQNLGPDFVGDFDQKDWICSFKYAGMEGYVYVQASPTGCTSHWGFYPDIGVDSAVIYVNGKYETLNDVTYDWGGNHHADSFRFSYDGKVFEYSRSSINGFAFRPCHEMDCLKVYEANGTTLIEDGCNINSDDLSKVRQLPIVCRFANLEDGSFGDWTDNFELCPGDRRLNK